MKSVLFITNIPSPYRVAFFNELGKQCDLTVVFERKTANDRDKLWKADNARNYKAIYLNGIKIGTDGAFCFGILKYLANSQFDIIVIGGYSTPTSMLAICYMRMLRIKYILNADGGFIKDDNIFRKYMKKFFISGASAWLSSGRMTNDYLVHYGADISKIYKYPFTSIEQNDIYYPRKEIKDEIKLKLGINNRYVVLSVGQFIPRKGFDVLLKSWKHIDADARLIIVGGEPSKEYLEMIEELGLNQVEFLKFMNKTELVNYYKIADIFVLPTREDIWGLVINEALASGIPVITTDKCLSGLELVEDGQTGYIVLVNDSLALGKSIDQLLSDEELRELMTDNCLKKISDYTIEKMAGRHMDIFQEISRGNCDGKVSEGI